MRAPCREVYGERGAYPEDFYDVYRAYRTEDLRQWAADITPRKRGKQKGYHDGKLVAEVDRLRQRGRSERERVRDCSPPAAREAPTALRMRYRRAQKTALIPCPHYVPKSAD